MNNMILCIQKIIYEYYIMFSIYSCLCKKNFIQNQYVNTVVQYSKQSYNTHTQLSVKGKLSYVVKPEIIKNEYNRIENIVYDDDGNFGQFVSIDL
jgi:hypothetical protein